MKFETCERILFLLNVITLIACIGIIVAVIYL